MEKINNVIIIGSGPAGYNAALYCARGLLEPILFEGKIGEDIIPGGQLTTTTEVENYLGMDEGILGWDLSEKFKKHAIKYGTKVIDESVTKVDFSNKPYKIWYGDNEEPLLTKTVVIATGAFAKRLHVVGEDELWQKGISACAVCDGALPLFRNGRLFVVGGGDTAMEEALFLTKYAKEVFIVHRRDKFRASGFMAQKVISHPKIQILWNSSVVQAIGSSRLQSVVIHNHLTDEKYTESANGLFYAIGHQPNSSIFSSFIDTDVDGYIIVKPGTSQTSLSGIFAAGDVCDKIYRQAITAAGFGCMAAHDVDNYLQHL